MKFSRYLLLNEETSAIDLRFDGWIRSAVHGPKVGHNEWDCASVCEWDRNFQRCYRYVLFNNLVLAVSKMGQLSESGTLPECKMVLITRFFCHPCIRIKKKWCRKITWCSRNGTDVLKWDITRMPCVLRPTIVLSSFYTKEVTELSHKKGRKHVFLRRDTDLK